MPEIDDIVPTMTPVTPEQLAQLPSESRELLLRVIAHYETIIKDFRVQLAAAQTQDQRELFA